MEEFRNEVLRVDEDDFMKAVLESGMSGKAFQESVDLIEDWYKKQPHFPKDKFDRRFIERFFFWCKLRIEKTKTKLENLMTARNTMPEFLCDRDPFRKDIVKISRTAQIIVLPKKTANNERITIFRLMDTDLDDFDPILSFKTLFMYADMRIHMDSPGPNIFINDCSNMKMSLVLKITPVHLKKLFHIIENCYPLIIQGVHYTNVPSYAVWLVNLIKSIVKTKLSERIHIHRTKEDLLEKIPKDVLPKDLGGDFPMTLDEINEVRLKNIQSNEWKDFFYKLDQTKTDEKRRPQNRHNLMLNDDCFGVEGSFRKLDLD